MKIHMNACIKVQDELLTVTFIFIIKAQSEAEAARPAILK